MPDKKPTLKHLFNDKLPEILFFDTSFIISAFLNPAQDAKPKIKKQSEVAKEFVKRIVGTKSGGAVYSFLFTEFWNVCLVSEICVEYNIRTQNPILSARQKLKDKPETLNENIKKRLDQHKKNLEIFMESLNGFMIIESDYEIHSLAYKLMKKYHISIYDTIHIAAMKHVGEANFVAFDKDFDNCYDINLWKEYS